MQTHGGVPAEEAITARERRLSVRLLVDWNRNGLFDHELSDMTEYVGDVETDRALKGSAPEELFLIEGSSAASMTVTVGGEYNGLSMVQVLSMFSFLSPFYMEDIVGSEIFYDIGVETSVGTIWYPQFRGFVQTITPGRSGNSVIITALDRVEVMRKNVTLPHWTMEEARMAANPINSPIEAQWIINTVLKQVNVSDSPYRPATASELGVTSPDEGTLYFNSNSGGIPPVIGNTDSANGTLDDSLGDPWYEGGVKHPEAADPTAPSLVPRIIAGSPNAAPGQTSRLTRMDSDLVTGTHYVSFTIDASQPNWDLQLKTLNQIASVTLFDAHSIVFETQAGTGAIRCYDPGLGGFITPHVPLPVGLTSFRVYLIWENQPAGGRYYLRVGPNFTGFTATAYTPSGVEGSAVSSHLRGYVAVRGFASITDFAYVRTNATGVSTTDVSTVVAKYAADVDRSNNRISALTHSTTLDAWAVVQDVAAQEMGSVFWDENGVFKFWTFQRMIDKLASPVRTLSLDDISDLSVTYSLDSIRNSWTVKQSKIRLTDVRAERGYAAFAFQSSDVDQFVTPPNSTRTFRINESFEEIFHQDLFRKKTVAGATWPGTPYTSDAFHAAYVVQYSATGTGGWAENNAAADLDVRPIWDEQGYPALRVRNPTANYARLATDANEPACRFFASIKTETDLGLTTYSDASSIGKYGTRSLDIDGQWIQDQYNANGLVPVLMSRTLAPIPRTDAITTAGDPRIQLGDALIIKDPNGIGDDLKVQVYGIRRSFSKDNGLTDQLTVEIARPTFPGIWDSPVFGRWDETFNWS